jgi:hypothetical protein
VDGCLTKAHAVGTILRRGRNTANHVAGIDVFESTLRLALAKVILNLALEKNADVSETLVPGRVGPGGFNHVLPGTLGHNDQGVAASNDALPQLLEKAVITLQCERHFRNKHAVGITAGNRCGAGDEARMAAHQLDQANAIPGASRLGMCRSDGIDGGGASRFVPEAFVHVGHIVVDGLRDPDNRELVATPGGLLSDGAPAPLCAIASYNEENVYLPLDELVHHALGLLRPA